LGTPVVALFGSSHAASTGPWVKDKLKSKIILLEAEAKLGCSKACYKYQCKKNKELPCINEIDPKQVLLSCCSILGKEGATVETFDKYEYQRLFGKISGYTTVYNCETMGIPYVESIRSMLGFCDEVVVLDGCSADGTYEKVQELAALDPRVKVFQNEWDWNEPGIDGLQKAYARAMCDSDSDFLWQQDADEIVHENDYNKIKMITKRFPNADILHLPVIELWGDSKHATGRRHCWKWRMSRNKPDITHSINAAARLTNEKTGKIYAKDGMSDGCEYVNTMTYQMVPHVGFYSEQIEAARRHMPKDYEKGINEVFEKLPSVWHTSWMNIDKKIKQLKKGGSWDRLWSLLYQKESMERFPGIETEEQIQELAKKLSDDGGEAGDEVKYKFEVTQNPPKLLTEWIEKGKK